MNNERPHYCSSICADEAKQAGVLHPLDEWVDTESAEYLNAHPDTPERCDWC